VANSIACVDWFEWDYRPLDRHTITNCRQDFSRAKLQKSEISLARWIEWNPQDSGLVRRVHLGSWQWLICREPEFHWLSLVRALKVFRQWISGQWDDSIQRIRFLVRDWTHTKSYWVAENREKPSEESPVNQRVRQVPRTVQYSVRSTKASRWTGKSSRGSYLWLFGPYSLLGQFRSGPLSVDRETCVGQSKPVFKSLTGQYRKVAYQGLLANGKQRDLQVCIVESGQKFWSLFATDRGRGDSVRGPFQGTLSSFRKRGPATKVQTLYGQASARNIVWHSVPRPKVADKIWS
jgi:hypothetical protein